MKNNKKVRTTEEKIKAIDYYFANPTLCAFRNLMVRESEEIRVNQKEDGDN